LVHYQILDRYIAQEITKGKVFLNFGAGHAGISNLCWLHGMSIINVEPSSLPSFYRERWNTVFDISEVQDHTVDLVYGSHSLEHVQNIQEFKNEVARVLKPGGYVFWEVPNANSPCNGAQLQRVDVPHTYYFEGKFFKNWFSDVLLCAEYEDGHTNENIQRWDEFQCAGGDVIRALGRLD
jgi:SAM-dependent methyltransferase